MKGLLFTYLLTYGGAVVSLFRPFTGLLIYICFSIVKPDVLWAFSVPAGNYARIIFVALGVGWLMAGCGSWRFGRATRSIVALCFYVAWAAVSATQAPNSTLAWVTVWEAVKIALALIIGLSLIDSVERLTQIAWTIVASLGYLAFEFNMSYYSGENYLRNVGFAGMEEKTVSIMMIIGAAVALFLAMSTKRTSLKVIGLVSALLMIHVPLFSYSRGGILGLIATAGVLFVLIPKKPAHLALAVAVLLVGLRLAGPEVRAFFMTSFAEADERDASAQSRLDLWAQAWDTIRDRPLLGIGPRHWQAWSVSRYGWQTGKEVHNTWLQSAAELGVPATLSLVYFFCSAGFGLWRVARNRALSSLESVYARMVVAAMAGFAVSSQFITVYGLDVPYFVALIGAGLLKLSSTATQPVAVMAVGTTPLNDRRGLMTAGLR